MKIFARVGFVFAALTFGPAAMAADMPLKAPAVVPAVVPSWTGFYLGLNEGYTWSSRSTIDTVETPVTGGPGFGLLFSDLAAAASAGGTTSIAAKRSGFIGGGQIGWNYQFNSSWVGGVEADLQGISGGSGVGAVTLVTSLPHAAALSYQTTTGVSSELNYLGTVRGRFGYATPVFFLYGTGGLAYGHVASGFNMLSVTPPVTNGPTISTSASASDTRTGWAAGAGVEGMVTPSWSVKAEYLYYDLGSIVSNAVLVQPHGGFTAFMNPVQSSAHFSGHIIRAGVNYHFNLFN